MTLGQTASALALAALPLTALTAPALAERGGDGDLRVLYWQAPTLLNPYLSTAGKDVDPASMVIEPLALVAPDGSLTPVLAAGIPSLENGGIAGDFTSVTWKLKPGLLWSDGSAVTAADVQFTADVCHTGLKGDHVGDVSHSDVCHVAHINLNGSTHTVFTGSVLLCGHHHSAELDTRFVHDG